MKELIKLIIEFHFMGHSSVFIDNTHCLVDFPHLTMQVEIMQAKQPHLFPNFNNLIMLPVITKTMTVFTDHPSECNTTGSVTPIDNFTRPASLLVPYAISTTVINNSAVRPTNATKIRYTIKRSTQIAVQ